MFITRRRNFRIFDKSSPSDERALRNLEADGSQDRLLTYDSDGEGGILDGGVNGKYPPKRRNCFGAAIFTPNTARFRNNFHSRVLQRFPFLIEMFYWIINYAFYRFTAVASTALFAGRGIWETAQAHGIAVLDAEEYSLLRFLFPISERQVQQWFMHGHQDALTALNKAYALIHIPGTVG